MNVTFLSSKVFVTVAFLLACSTTGFGQEFYEGKSVAIVVGGPPGGGLDTYTRVLAKHLPKHIPGSPRIIVRNMPGAGTVIAANHVYNTAKPDGLTIGHFIGGLILTQVLGAGGMEFDARMFEYIGAPVRETPVCVLSSRVGIRSVQEWRKAEKPVNIGATAPGSDNYDVPKIMQHVIGLPIHLVTGYAGTAPIGMAIKRGEVDGMCLGLDSLKQRFGEALDAKELIILLQARGMPHPELPDIPLLIKFAKNKEGRTLIEAGIHSKSSVFRPFVLPPQTPQERIQVLRRAFMDTMKDSNFLATAKKARLGVDPVSGEEVEQIVKELFELDRSRINKLRDIFQ